MICAALAAFSAPAGSSGSSSGMRIGDWLGAPSASARDCSAAAPSSCGSARWLNSQASGAHQLGLPG